MKGYLAWLLFMVTKYPLYSNRMLYFRTKLMFRLLFCSLHQKIHSMHKTLLCILCVLCILTAEQQSKHQLFSNKAFGWNKGYFITNVVAVEHGRYIQSVLYAETVSSTGSAWYVGSFKLCYVYVDCLLCGRLWSERC